MDRFEEAGEKKSGRCDYLCFAELDEGIEGPEHGGQKFELVDLGHELVIVIVGRVDGSVIAGII